MAQGEHQELIDFVARLEASARGRFVRWDGRLWRQVVDGPAAQLAQGLDGRGGDQAAAQKVLEGYLRLCCEGIGLGYLFPDMAGAENFFTLAFGALLPRLLPALPPARGVEALAALWNLGENLENSPAWLRRIFCRVGRDLASLDGLEALVEGVSRLTLEAPEEPLGDTPQNMWIDLGDEDRRFLPGALHFVAPTVVCVHDRRRTGPAKEPVSMGVWLAPRPLVLGPMGCGEVVKEPKKPPVDPRFDEPFAVADNAWRAAATLVTSQRLLALLP